MTDSLCGHPGAAVHACASFDRTRRYRWELHRRWAAGRRTVVWVMLNPSAADGGSDDPTLRRCIGFSQLWGFDALAVVNLFSLASTSPAALRRHPRPVGDRTDETITRLAARGGAVVAAWGADRAAADREHQVLDLLPDPLCLGLTAAGAPRHPLYLPKHARPRPLAAAPRR